MYTLRVLWKDGQTSDIWHNPNFWQVRRRKQRLRYEADVEERRKAFGVIDDAPRKVGKCCPSLFGGVWTTGRSQEPLLPGEDRGSGGAGAGEGNNEDGDSA